VGAGGGTGGGIGKSTPGGTGTGSTPGGTTPGPKGLVTPPTRPFSNGGTPPLVTPPKEQILKFGISISESPGKWLPEAKNTVLHSKDLQVHKG